MSIYFYIVRWYFKFGIDNFVFFVFFLILNGVIKFFFNYVFVRLEKVGFYNFLLYVNFVRYFIFFIGLVCIFLLCTLRIIL